MQLYPPPIHQHHVPQPATHRGYSIHHAQAAHRAAASHRNERASHTEDKVALSRHAKRALAGDKHADAPAGGGKNQVSAFLGHAASAYGANAAVLHNIARRESHFNTGHIANTTDSNARAGHPSRGMFQFIKTTFDSFSQKAHAANPGAWKGVSREWSNWKAQALTASWAITHGQGNQWSTYRQSIRDARSGH